MRDHHWETHESRMEYLLERILEELESLRLSIEFTTEDDPKEGA